MSASRFALKEAKSKGMFEGVAKPYCRESRRASAMEAKFQVIFLGTQLVYRQLIRLSILTLRQSTKPKLKQEYKQIVSFLNGVAVFIPSDIKEVLKNSPNVDTTPPTQPILNQQSLLAIPPRRSPRRPTSTRSTTNNNILELFRFC